MVSLVYIIQHNPDRVSALLQTGLAPATPASDNQSRKDSGIFMRIIRQQIDMENCSYPPEWIASPEKILFIDIETTGFTAKNSFLYLIGTACFEEGEWYVKQWFANTYDEEAEILSSFFSFASGFTHLVHFNGNNFDLPYLMDKCRQHHLPYDFSHFEGIDIYRRIAPYKNFLRLPNCKQKTLEAFLSIDREDRFNGGELISVYHAYVKDPTDYGFKALTLHNANDIRGMVALLPILSFYDLFNKPVKPKKVQANYYHGLDGRKRQEVIMKLALPSPLPLPVSGSANGCYFRGEGAEGSLRVPLYEEEMKFFYSNYKNYYYLPDEDMAAHKSVAGYVDRKHRIQATPATCYTRKISSYLPEWEPVFEPFYKRDYKDKELFFELTEEMKKQRPLFAAYAEHILHMIAACSNKNI